MTPLALSGRAKSLRVAGSRDHRLLLRMRSRVVGSNADFAEEDTAILLDAADMQWAKSKGLQRVAAFADFSEADLQHFPTVVQFDEQFRYLSDGDLVGVDVASQRFRTFYRKSSRHNSLLVTERCNHYCLMCSQPPKDTDDGWLLEEIAAAIPLIDPLTPSLGFTGGEPLTDWRRFLEVIELTQHALPRTALHVLTNGRAFADKQISAAWAALNHPNLMAGIPIYSAVDHIHDHVVQAKNAFNETLLGILRLKDLGQRVEIRVVLHALTAPRIVETCRWIARNLPFVNHVALMGLENTGFAIANDAQLWIDPLDYQEDLSRGARALLAAGVPVSIYNLPLCLVETSVRHIAVQSISDWKNAYVADCDDCVARPQCAGFFSSGRPKFSRGIAPIASLPVV